MSTEISSLLVSSPDVCGGRLHIDGTQITVNQIVLLYKQGRNAEDIVNEHPPLTLAQVYAALAYYHSNQEEIEADLAIERNETTGPRNPLPDLLEKETWLEAFKALQRNLSLTPAKAAKWQDAVREMRR